MPSIWKENFLPFSPSWFWCHSKKKGLIVWSDMGGVQYSLNEPYQLPRSLVRQTRQTTVYCAGGRKEAIKQLNGEIKSKAAHNLYTIILITRGEQKAPYSRITVCKSI